MADEPRERREGDRRMQDALAADVAELREAVLGLSHRTEQLANNIGAVNDLQRQQAVTDRKAADAVLEAAKAIQAVKDVEKASATKDELEEREKVIRTQVLAYRQRLMGRIVAASIAGVFVLFVVGLLAANYVASQNQHNYDQCIAGQQTLKTVETYLAVVNDNSTNPQIKKAAGDVVGALANPKAQTDCEALK